MQAENKIRAAAKYLCKMSLVALAYYLTGRFGLLLAVPPGYATAVWPPSGVILAALLCLGYRYWPGVLIGSFCLNLFTSFNPADSSTMLLSGGMAVIIASGATIEGLFSAWLVRRFLAIPNPLEQARDIILLVILGGPVGCLVNSTISVTSLASAGVIEWSDFGINWLTWWVGDSIGVVVFTPIMMLILAPSNLVSFSRKLLVTAILSIAFTSTIYVFYIARKAEMINEKVDFERNASNIHQQLENDLQNYSDALNSIARFYEASDFVSPLEFRTFVKRLFVEYPSIHALAWNQAVTHADRKGFETKLREEGFADYSIKDLSSKGKMSVAPARPIYFPITYVEPAANNKHTLGYDTYVEGQRKLTLDKARDSGEAVVTGRINIVQDYGQLNAFIIYQPIYKNYHPIATIAQRRENILGYAAGVFILPDILYPLSQIARNNNLAFKLIDNTATSNDLKNLYESQNKDPVSSRDTYLRWNKPITFAGHEWALQVMPTKSYFTSNHNWTVWLVLTGGLLMTGLFGAFLLMVTGRTDIVRRLVETKTIDLEESNKMNNAIFSSATALMIATDENGLVLAFNKAAEDSLGYSSQDIVNTFTPALWHKDDEIIRRAEELSEEYGDVIKNGNDVFTYKPRREGSESREWIIIRKDGSTFPGRLTVTPLKNTSGLITGFLGVIEDISERVRQERALKSSEENFRLSFENAVIGKALVSPEGKWIKVNKALCNILGYNSAELLEIDFQTLTHPDDLKLDMEFLQQMLRKEIQNYQMEKRYFHKNGQLVWVLLSVSLVWDANDKPIYFISQIQDVTPAKENAEKHRIAEERLYLATIGTSDGLWDWNILTGENYFSPRFMEDLGYSENELPHHIDTFKYLLHMDDLDRVRETVHDHWHHLTLYDIELRLRHKDGYYVWFNARGQAVWDENDTPIRMTGFTTNIDKRKKAQAAFQKAHDELNLIFNNVNAKIWFKDDKNNILRLNHAAATSMGGEIEDFENKSTFDLFPELADKYLEDDLEVINSGKPKLAIIEKFMPKDAPSAWVSVDKIPYEDEVSGIRGVFVVATDITELKNSEEQREQLVAKLTESNTELERFAYVASHDMQEPLRMISNFSTIIAEEYGSRLDADGKQCLSLVTDSALRMQTMVADLLEYARVGNDLSRFVKINAAEEFGHVLENLVTTIAKHDAVITNDKLPEIMGIPVQFMRLLQNLIGNALKYQAEDVIPVIHVGVEEDGDHWRFSVKDNGIGMAEEYVERIFEPFKRLHSWQQYHGTGIGLAVCRKIVENHGGRIWATSKPGAGSIFYFTIPKLRGEL